MLYIVSTPIGNLGDITYRAIETLKSADLIACEDTRKTRILTQRYGVKTPLTSFYEYNKRVKGDYLIRLLQEGKSVALVSDAGTPGISDPGFTLIKSCLDAGIKVVPIPGPTALIAALSVSGFATDRFFFQGFLPIKPGARRNRLLWLKGLGETVIIYESPHRLLKTLADMNLVLGNAPLAVLREVTKLFEEVIRSDAGRLAEHFTKNKPKGEFVIIF